MDNFVLFICGMAITVISGMGVLVYMVNLGYRQRHKVGLPDTAVEIPVEPSK